MPNTFKLSNLIANFKKLPHQIDAVNFADDCIAKKGSLDESDFAEFVRMFRTPNNLIAVQQLAAIAPTCRFDRLTQLAPFINQTMAENSIDTPLRIVHFIAQIAHESDSFNTNEEYATGADYEGRTDLGNTQAGDGRRFKGRGLIQVTGRFNYQACGTALGVDLIAHPERLADFDLAARSAGWFWNREALNEFADRDDILTITRIINGGQNGLEDRRAYLQSAKNVFCI